MKGAILPIFIAIVILAGVGTVVSWVFFSRSRELQKIEIPQSYLETTDTSRFAVQPLYITRKFPDDSLLLLFPKGNSRSQLFIYDQENYNRLLFGDHKGNPKPQRDAQALKAIFGRTVLNLSSYPSGKYYVHVTYCSFGGFFEIEILDEGN
ncbi:MAG TPA: hypothetical protein VL651_08625 [Bacteroidia bacterium]|jgi:hypothetical protein|nr:hypothetical protein [Bacteroidia bacterium]